MSTYFGGSELPSFTRFNAIETTTVGSYRVPSRCGIHVRKGGWIQAKHITLDELWFHFDVSMALISPSSQPVTIMSSQGVALFTISGNGDIRVGTSLIGNAAVFTAGLFTFDIHLRNGTNGLVELYVDKQIVFSATGNFALADMSAIRLAPTGTDATTNTNTVFSQVIVADESTIGFQLATLGLTSSGDSSEWVGTIDKINEIVLDDTTYINSANAGQVNTYNTADLNINYSNVKAVIVSALARYAEVGPKNLDAVIRISGTNYLANMSDLGAGFTASQAIMHVNPATGNPWTPTEINNSQLGIRSKV